MFVCFLRERYLIKSGARSGILDRAVIGVKEMETSTGESQTKSEYLDSN